MADTNNPVAFIRQYRLIIGEVNSDSGNTSTRVDKQSAVITDNHIEFDITKTDDSKNNTAEIRLYNLSDTTIALFDKKDVLVSLEVGYVGDENLQLIFRGNKANIITKKNGPDKITTIYAADGYTTVREGRLAKTFPKNSTVRQIIQDIISYGMPEIKANTLKGSALDRVYKNGYSLVGSSTKQMDDICKANRLQWSISNNDTVIVKPVGGSHQETTQAVLLSPETGLVESPEKINQDIKDLKKDLKVPKDAGVRLKSLLNPKIVVGGYIKLEKSTVPDGFYKVEKLQHLGSYEGNDWYTILDCVVTSEVK